HCRLRKPGEGPSWATASPRARRSSSSRRRRSISSRIQTHAVCQPKAQSRPKCERAAASSSTWNGCGSKRCANVLMSSAVKTWLPISTVSPTRMSSKNFMARPALLGGAPAEHRTYGQNHQHLVGGIDELEAEFDESQVGPAARSAGLEHGGTQRDPLAGTQRRQPLHLFHAGRAH